MEKILSITDTTWTDGRDHEYEGYVIKTTEQEIKVGIDNYSSCCEQWGYLTSEDSLDDFIGAELLTVNLVDKALNVKVLDATSSDDIDIMFVNFETSKGTFQLVVYNIHNGYYGHEAVVISKKLNFQAVL